MKSFNPPVSYRYAQWLSGNNPSQIRRMVSREIPVDLRSHRVRAELSKVSRGVVVSNKVTSRAIIEPIEKRYYALTNNQYLVYKEALQESNVRRIGEKIGVSRDTAKCTIKRLVELGLLKKDGNEWSSVPGRIAVDVPYSPLKPSGEALLEMYSEGALDLAIYDKPGNSHALTAKRIALKHLEKEGSAMMTEEEVYVLTDQGRIYAERLYEHKDQRFRG